MLFVAVKPKSSASQVCCLTDRPHPSLVGEGPFPAVLDLCTFMSEKRASLLASKGFVVLAVPVFFEKPDVSGKMHLDHFEEAVTFLKQVPQVTGIYNHNWCLVVQQKKKKNCPPCP